MNFFRMAFAMLAVIFATSLSFADGYLKFVYQDKWGFSRTEVFENNGQYEGQKMGTGGYAEITARSTPTHFYYDVGGASNWFVRDVADKTWAYRAKFSGNRLANFSSAFLNGGVVIRGKMEDVVDYDISTYKNKKGKWIFTMTWLNFTLQMESDPKYGAGSCKGKLLVNNTDTVGEVICDSSGSLENALFQDPDQIAAWIVDDFVFVPQQTQPKP